MIKNKTGAILVIAIALLLSSCSIGRKYQRPELIVPSIFSAKAPADTANSIGDIAWNAFFTDTLLHSLVQKGIAYNHDLLIAINRMDIARQVVTQSKQLQLPELNLQVAGQYNRPSKNSLNGLSTNTFLNKSHIENYLAVASLSWEADIWGKIRGQKQVALNQYLQTAEAGKAVQTRLVANIAEGFFNLLMLDKQLDIARRNLLLSDSFLLATRLLKDAGNVNALAVQQAASQKQSTASLIPELEQNIALQENALQLLTGQLPGALARKTSLNDISIREDLSTGLPIAMVSRRPDVRSEEIALKIATTKIGIAQANMYPALNITAGAGLESFKSSNWFNIPNSLFGIVAGSIAQPIFNRRELKTGFEIAKLEREQAVIRFRQSVLQASTEVANSLVQTEKLREQRVIATEQVSISKQAVRNAQLLFKSDMANYLEVITAQSNALEAELSYAAIQRSQLSAIVELYRALGGGWQ